MTSAALCYFSQTGTTRTIAEHIAEGLTRSGVSPALYPMDETDPETLLAHDIIGIGLPVYMFRPPFNVLDFVQNLPDLSGKSFFVFVLFGSHPGSTAAIIRTLLAKKGGRDLGFHYSRGADLYAGYVKRGTLLSPDRPSPDEKEDAATFGKALPARFTDPAFTPEKDPHSATVIDLIERATCHRFLGRHLYTRLFTVDKARCNGCGHCATLCPTDNITFDENGHPLIGRDCLLCLSCELRCPKEALSSPFTSTFLAPVMAFNLWQAKRLGVDHAPVRWAKGQVRRLTAPGDGTPPQKRWITEKK
ncbi:EFR1 family ferrodoxin [Desulfoluna sp.]|uniref:EFR1 family ferrodoxin n=1 Tax=Desulfoluna sp. TaxID=2045199 RepID=UPI002625B39F|nr:EFR1 family ferrodoxin [Desulfoluna sp.]